MPTLDELCTPLGPQGDTVVVIVKLYINGVEYVPARSYFRASKKQQFTITLNNAAMIMLKQNDSVRVAVDFENADDTVFLIGAARMSIFKLRQWT